MENNLKKPRKLRLSDENQNRQFLQANLHQPALFPSGTPDGNRVDFSVVNTGAANINAFLRLRGITRKLDSFKATHCEVSQYDFIMIEKVFNAISKVFGSKSEKDLKKIWPIVDEIKSYEDELKALSDDQLKAKTEEFKNEIREATAATQQRIDEIKKQLSTLEETEEELTAERRQQLSDELEELDQEWLDIAEEILEDILPEAFAVLKETCRRFVGTSWKVAGADMTWQMVPFDVQLVGAIVLHQGRISEMKTGEGKTLVAIFPTYLNALVGRGVHIVTVNDYLAKRDAEWNAPIFEFHGLSVDCIDKYQPNSPERREAYKCDVIYGTNSEFGFDYLRDNMAITPEMLVQQGHHFTIVDEVDSVLIDEARTPLIISGPVPKDNQSEKYTELKPRVENLVNTQRKLINEFVNDAERALEEGDTERAGKQLLRAQRGFPKNNKFRKLTQEADVQRLVEQTEYLYLQDQGKNMHLIDEEMYYVVDQKQNTIEMTDKGRELLTRDGEDPDFFVIPDFGEESAKIDEEFEKRESEEIDRIKNKEDYSPEFKEQQIAKAKENLRQEKAEKESDLQRTFSEKSERIHSVNQLLKAYSLFENDDEYIVQEGKVQIVDEHTGRAMPGRRFSDGLHQAIEAKENVKVEAATQTYASITLQNYFRMYHKIAGMTGTAITEEDEFQEIYSMDVVEIPTNEPVRRIDHDDLIYRTKREKFNAVLEKITEYNQRGQPVLVGTTSVEASEKLSRMLKREKIQHNVLNAKHNQKESEIVAQAGQRGAVTIATNMAGRGTDIKLGEGVKDLGGLAIIGTERHESRRTDLQLRGRSGRQGDPGESQFFVSLEDDLMRLFGESLAKTMDRIKFDEGEVLQHSWLSKSLERAQTKVEQNNFSIRKRQLEFDDVLNNQRKVVYERRRNALLGEQLANEILNMLEDTISSIVDEHYENGEYDAIQERVLRLLAVDVELDREHWSNLGREGLVDLIFERALETYRQKEKRISEPFHKVIKRIEDSDSDNKPSRVQIIFTDGKRRMRVIIDVKEALESEGKEVLRSLERSSVLSIIDEKWMEHLRELDTVKEGIGLRSFGQRDPLREYKREAYNMFVELVDQMNMDITSLIWRAVPEATPDQSQMKQAQDSPQRRMVDPSKLTASQASAENMGIKFGDGDQNRQQAQANGGQQKRQPEVVGDKVGRNDPCPCGSGKKYKQCCGR